MTRKLLLALILAFVAPAVPSAIWTAENDWRNARAELGGI